MNQIQDSAAPPAPPSALQWIRQNLFRTWFDGLLTILSAAVLYLVLSGAIRWVFTAADWRPISENLTLFLVGQYPRDQLWRVAVAAGMVSLLLGISWGLWSGMLRSFAVTLLAFYLILAIVPSVSLTPEIRFYLGGSPLIVLGGFLLGRRFQPGGTLILSAWVSSAVISFFLLRGLNPVPALGRVEINLWGGLIVTAILAVGGIVISFPIGVLLALGRRSSLPVVSVFSTGFIELIRGVPLISILFLFSIIVPLFLPSNVRFDRMLRALVGMIVFSAAYTAENVRGGLQAIPPGQYEAANATGLSNFHTTMLIVLPQALRKVIPAIVGQFISLFKDTTLAAGVAVLEILSIGRSVLQGNPEYIGRQAEVYIFVAAIFWVFSYSMSVTSRQIEIRLGVGEY
jgi:general L-amino acid transport system permease protein